MVWGVLAMMAFYLTDTWFVAQLGSDELAAMSFCFPVVMVLISLGIGLMAGTSSTIARALGARDSKRVQRLTTDALALSLALSLLVGGIGLLTIDPVFRALGTPPEILPMVRDYMTVWYAGYPAFLLPMVGIGAIRATGGTRIQSSLMIGGAALNLVLDPLLIFGLLGSPRLEIQGAAIATVLARSVTLIIGGWAIHWRLRMLDFTVPRRAALLASWRSVLHVGLPAAGTNMIIPAANAVIIALVATFGTEAVAGFGAAVRIEGVVLVAFYALSAIIGPFVGQNLGAGKPARIITALTLTTKFCILFGLLLAALLWAVGGQVLAWFSDSAAVVSAGRLYLLIVSVSFGAEGIVMVTNAAFNGLGRPLPAVAISLLRMLVLYLPAALLLAGPFGLTGVFAAACVANIITAAVAHLWFRHSFLRTQPRSDSPA